MAPVPPSASPPTRVIWAVSDGRRGMENQALGLAEAIARRIPAEIETKHIAVAHTLSWLPYSAWGTGLISPFSALRKESDSFIAPWPDIFIGCGRLAMAASLAVRKASNGHTFTVQTQDPRVNPENFDLVLPPVHDGLEGPNVMPLLGAPNRVTRSVLDDARGQFASLFDGLPRPLAAVMIGGASKSHQMGPAETQEIASWLKGLVAQGVGLAITMSRRTGAENEAALRKALEGTGAWIWDGADENPYFGLLAHADAVLVTEDSVNMVTEAAATGKPVYLLPLGGGSAKIRRFHEEMESRGIARPFTGTLESWSYPPLDETGRAAEAIIQALESRAATLK